MKLLALTRIIALTLSIIPVAGNAEDLSVVKVDGGMIRGAETNGLLVFKGIPFAQPPVGALRWRAPQPVKPWEGTRDATAFSADPAQPAYLVPPGARMSEDCLYLNVWRPAKSGDKPLPVMFWIYGGGLVKGAASLYPGEFLAKQGIMVVTVNYRLGRLGFFAHPALEREAPDEPHGNYGYMDQIAALKWVHRNIAALGGDPKNVTIAGESAGGGSVLVLLTSPMARGLFQRAILESPAIPTPRAGAASMRQLADAESIADEYAREHSLQGDDANVLAGLRALSVDEVTKDMDAYALAIFGGPELSGMSHSIIDGHLVVESPESALRAERQAGVPVLVGANDRDLAMSPARTKDALFARFGALAPEARKLYDPSGDTGFTDLLQNVCADMGMVEPSRHLAERTAAAGQPAYFYRFSYVPEKLRQKMPGATHASEIMFAFDCVPLLLKDRTTETDVAMAKTMSGYWVDFVKTGNPNGGGRPTWLPYDPATRDVLDFANDGVRFGPDPLKARLDLWRSVWDAPSP